jgi:hypothetical protein
LTTKMKMLASTVQFSSYGREDVVRARRRHPAATPRGRRGGALCGADESRTKRSRPLTVTGT